MGIHKTALLETVQRLINKHGADHPELKADLEALRSDIEKSSTRTPEQRAGDMLRIASWVKWIYDLLP